jgi:Spondin_N
MSIRLKLVAALGAAAVLTLGAALPAASDDGPDLRTYRVTLVNLTDGQPFSPPVAATHNRSMRMFQVGRLASDELAAIAQAGNQVPMFNLFNSSDEVTEAVDVGRPVTRVGTVVDPPGPPGPFVDTVTFEITAERGDRLSLATMLICTNDGFLGLDAVRLPSHGARAFLINGYDAGRENNTQDSQHLVDPCTDLGPVPLPGDPDGNVDDGAVLTNPPMRIHHHPNIQDGVGELTVADHGWRDPVAVAVVSRIDEGEDEDDDDD